MKKILLIFFVLLTWSSLPSYAGGGITHLFIAEQTIAHLPDKELRNLLLNHLDAYLVGADYPDSGYVKGAHYGELSHWDPFIYAFADYLKLKYAHPSTTDPKLVAFLFGCAVHRVSDEVIHQTFYNITKDKDFDGNWNQAHHYGDLGIDLLLTADKNLWSSYPRKWWVPVSDLLIVYHRLGKEFTSEEILWGNAVLATGYYTEKLLSPPAYPYLKWRMPWTATHYYDWPNGGVLANEQEVAVYLTNLWKYINNESASFLMAKQIVSTHYSESILNSFAASLLTSHIINVPILFLDDGSIELQQPLVQKPSKFQAEINQFIAKFAFVK